MQKAWTGWANLGIHSPLVSSCSSRRRPLVFTQSKLLAVAMLGLGSLLGYVAASGKLNALALGNGPPKETVRSTDGASAEECPNCCTGDTTKGQLLALAD